MNQHLPTASQQINIPLITPRESEIIELITFEFSTKEIASRLFLSYETVKSHRSNIFKKLDVKNIAGLVRVAIQCDLVDLRSQAI